MEPTTNSPAEPYEVVCLTCSNSFDAMTAPWCDCISQTRSLECPHCHVCACAARPQAREAMFRNAPARVWDRLHAGPPRSSGPEEGVAGQLALVVDDTIIIRTVASTVLRKMGFEVIMAEDGVAALELARSRKPDYILIDALLPKMDGREVCRRLKADPETASIKIAIMTALYTNPRYMVEATKTFHADDFLVKPVTSARLASSVEKLLGAAAHRSGRAARGLDGGNESGQDGTDEDAMAAERAGASGEDPETPLPSRATGSREASALAR